jgi:hypothetical protein
MNETIKETSIKKDKKKKSSQLGLIYQTHNPDHVTKINLWKASQNKLWSPNLNQLNVEG